MNNKQMSGDKKMKELTKILGLLAMLTLVSCGSKPTNMEDLGSCINGDKEMCQDLGDDTPPTTPVEPPVLEEELVMTDIKTITVEERILTFDKEKEIDGELNRIFTSDEIKYNNATWIKFKLFVREDGTATYQTMSKSFAFAWTWENTETTWEISEENILIIGETEVEFTL